MTPGSKPWTGRRRLVPKLRGIAAGLKNKSKRSLDLFNVAYGAYADARREADLDVEERPSWFLEVGQSAERSPWGASLPLVSRKARIYHYGLDTVLCGKQLAACHGYPHALDLGTLSEPQFRGLLGNGVFLPHLTICTAAAFLEESAPWHTSETRARAAAASASHAQASPSSLKSPGSGTSSGAGASSAKKKVRLSF